MSRADAVKAWQVEDSRYLLQTPWLSVRRDAVRTSSGVQIPDYHVIEGPDWCCCVCLTVEGHVVLVQQYRHGVRGHTVELPAGVVDRGETPLAAVQRELLEETGYSASSWQSLGRLSPDPSRQTQSAHLFLATGAERQSEPKQERTEDIHLLLHPWAERETLISQLSHGVHLSGLFLAERALPPKGST